MPADKIVDVEYDWIKIDDPQYDAVLFAIGGDEHVWLPRSLIEIDKDDKVVTLPEWLAIEKEIA